MKNKAILSYIWPVFGLAVMALSAHLLYGEFHNPHSQLSHISMSDLLTRLKQISNYNLFAAVLCTFIAYSSLAGYDRIALEHLKRKISWLFIGLCSFSAYALSHSIGASVFSGAAIRYRAYSTKGLNASEVAVLVGFCSFTFVLGVVILLALLLTFKPEITLLISPQLQSIFHNSIPPETIKKAGFIVGIILIFFVFGYIYGSWKHRPPLRIGKHIKIFYPSMKIVLKQLAIGPLELLGSTGIIYFMLPHDPAITFSVVLAVFLSSFTIGILSNAPGGGLGVFELSFLKLLPQINSIDVLVALIVFRFLYIIIPLILSIIFVIIFEVQQYYNNRKIR